jgi:hypothetical protein
MGYDLPREYIALKFFQFGMGAKYNKYSDSYICGCPICKEGKSAGRKQRCYYIPANNNIYCHNCGWSSTPFKWIAEVGSLDYREIIEDVKSCSIDIEDIITNNVNESIAREAAAPTLPKDCINLFDQTQINFFKDLNCVQAALKEIERRRLNTAINRPKALYISSSDIVHKNRLVIPFYDTNGEIIYYQSRKLLNTDDKPKYISKSNGMKSIYGIDQISDNLDQVFIFEGPINSFFVKNGLAVAGIQEKSEQSFTRKQLDQFNFLRTFEKIWVLDSQWIDSTSRSKTNILIKNGDKVFIWPEKAGKKYKDFNDLAIKFNLDEISPKFILDNSYSGISAEIMMKCIT